jgi:hemerythrin-like domain-containing protein
MKEHRDAIRHADELVELLAPPDIQEKISNPDQKKLREEIASHLDAFVEMAEGHFRTEEKLLLPAIRENFDLNDPAIREAVGCMSREHDQMHMFVERINELTPALRSDEPLDPHRAAELLRISYSVQSILRHHCTKEERDIYRLVEKLPMKEVSKIFDAIEHPPDISLDHLTKPLGTNESEGYKGEGHAEGPEN